NRRTSTTVRLRCFKPLNRLNRFRRLYYLSRSSSILDVYPPKNHHGIRAGDRIISWISQVLQLLGSRWFLTMPVTYAGMKKLAPLSGLLYKKARLGFGASFRRWFCVESGRGEDFGGELYRGKKFGAVWGNGDFGRLGLGNLASEWRPRPISPAAFDDQGLVEIACGGAHTLFLTERGDLYATGLNDFGQLEDGELYMWGKNGNGQLGLGKKAEKITFHPHKIDSLDGVTIKTASLGFEHSIAVTEQGEILSWGGGESGRLGHGHESNILGFHKSSRFFTILGQEHFCWNASLCLHFW
ncbi:regulator of chromosome condensation family protein, partial [Striga asiatica]